MSLKQKQKNDILRILADIGIAGQVEWSTTTTSLEKPKPVKFPKGTAVLQVGRTPWFLAISPDREAWWAPSAQVSTWHLKGHDFEQLMGDAICPWAKELKRELDEPQLWSPESGAVECQHVLLPHQQNDIYRALVQADARLNQVRWQGSGNHTHLSIDKYSLTINWRFDESRKAHIWSGTRAPGPEHPHEPFEVEGWDSMLPILQRWAQDLAEEQRECAVAPLSVRSSSEQDGSQPASSASAVLPSYLHSLSIRNLRCFEDATFQLQFPGRKAVGPDGFQNLNLIVGDNGSGKSTVLKAIALAILGGVLPHEGFRPYSLIRKKCQDADAVAVVQQRERQVEFKTVLSRLGHSEILKTWDSSREKRGDPDPLWFEDGPEYFLCGYGVTARRAEATEQFDKAARDKSRGRRYQRVASLFEEHYSLRPISNLFSELTGAPTGQPSRHLAEAMEILSQLLEGTATRWTAGITDGEMTFRLVDGLEVAADALSDGFRGFLSWVGDLLTSLCEVSPGALRDTPGIVLVDEIDQHLHPKWQRTVLSTLGRTFPNIQFVLTTHSPILVGCLPPENIHITERDANGHVVVRAADADFQGRMVDEILLSDYFQLHSTLSPEMERRRVEEARVRATLAHQLLDQPSEEKAREYLKLLTKALGE